MRPFLIYVLVAAAACDSDSSNPPAPDTGAAPTIDAAAGATDGGTAPTENASVTAFDHARIAFGGEQQREIAADVTFPPNGPWKSVTLHFELVEVMAAA